MSAQGIVIFAILIIILISAVLLVTKISIEEYKNPLTENEIILCILGLKIIFVLVLIFALYDIYF